MTTPPHFRDEEPGRDKEAEPLAKGHPADGRFC